MFVTDHVAQDGPIKRTDQIEEKLRYFLFSFANSHVFVSIVHKYVRRTTKGITFLGFLSPLPEFCTYLSTEDSCEPETISLE